MSPAAGLRRRGQVPQPERRGAAAASVALHCVVLAALAFVGIETSGPPAESPLIMAEFMTVERAAVPATTIDVLTTSPALVTEPAPSEPSPAPAVPQTEAPPPETPAVVPPRLAEQAPRPAEPTAEPPSQREPLERVADTQESPSVLPAEEPAAVPAASPSELVAPSRAFANHEQRAVRSRLSSWTGRFSPDEAASTLSWRDDGQQYTAVLRQVPSADAMGMQQLAIELTTERDGERLVTELRMNRVAFSNFAQFIDRWDPAVAIHDDPIDGRFHSNSEIRVSRDGRAKPVFNGPSNARGQRRSHGRPGSAQQADDVPWRHRDQRAAHRSAAARRRLSSRARCRRTGCIASNESR